MKLNNWCLKMLNEIIEKEVKILSIDDIYKNDNRIYKELKTYQMVLNLEDDFEERKDVNAHY